MLLDRETQCEYCATSFRTSKSAQVFCSPRCRVRYHRENRLQCFYCGDLATERDHVAPRPFNSSIRGSNTHDETVPCCSSCNVLKGTLVRENLSEVVYEMAGRLARKANLNRTYIEWSDEELDEISYSLGTFIRSHQLRYSRAQRRHVRMIRRAMQLKSKENKSEPAVAVRPMQGPPAPKLKKGRPNYVRSVKRGTPLS